MSVEAAAGLTGLGPGGFHAGAGAADRVDAGAFAAGGAAADRVDAGAFAAGGAPGERVTVNVVGRASRALDLAIGLTGDTRTNAINRALQLYAYVELVAARGGSVRVRDSSGSELDLLRILRAG